MRFIVILLCWLYFIPLSAQVKSQAGGFIENKGQVVDLNGRPNNDVKFLLNTEGLNVQLRSTGFSYDVYEVSEKRASKKRRRASDNKTDSVYRYRFHRIDVDFLDSNASNLIAEDKSADSDNYYNVGHVPNGVLNVHKYSKVTYKNIYDKIDVVFFIPDDKSKPVEYNFIIHPGGKVEAIKLKFNGAKSVLADDAVRLKVRFGPMDETIPLSWIEAGNKKQNVAVHYKKLGKNVYGFDTMPHTANVTLVIDPVPVRLWGTYFHRNITENIASKVLSDAAGNVLVSGMVSLTNNIATSGIFQSEADLSENNSFLTKFNPDGQRIWTTYISNNPNIAFVRDFVIDSNDDYYLAGNTWGGQGTEASTVLVTPGAHKTVTGGFYSEAFLLKMNSDGHRIWGTFFGGDDNDSIETICLDSSQNIIVAGNTRSMGAITTPGSYMPSYPYFISAYEAGFFAKFSPSGQQLYGSYFNGAIKKSAIDSQDNVYFAAPYVVISEYQDIATSGAHQTTCNTRDIFLAKFNAAFDKQWVTYYGGNETTDSFGNSDRCSSLEIDNADNIYLIGTTSSPNNIATPGSFKVTLAANFINAFVAKFNSDGVRLWGTYYGPNSGYSDTNTCNSGAINKTSGEIYLFGNTRQASYYGNADSFQPQNDGSDECYITKLDSSGFPVWSTYYGTESQDFSESISYRDNMIYCMGYSTGIATNGNDLGTPGTYMPEGGGFKYFIAKFQDCNSPPQVVASTPTCVGDTIELTASGGTGYAWTGPNGFTSSIANPIIPNATAVNSGLYSCLITGTGDCDGIVTVIVNVGDSVAPVPDVASLPAINGDCNTIVTVVPTATDECAGVITGTTTDPLSYSVAGSYTITWTYDDGNGNVSTQQQSVTISSVALPIATSPQTFCVQQNATLGTIPVSGQNLTWYDATGSVLANTTVLASGTYYVTQTINNCESQPIAVAVNIQDTPPATGSAVQTFCTTQQTTLGDVTIMGDNIIWYDANTGGLVLANNTPLQDGVTYYATQTVNNCESVIRFGVTVDLINTLNANDYGITMCDDGNDGIQNIDLTDYQNDLIFDAANHTFEYYTSSTGAENQTTAEAISSISAYQMPLGNTILFVRIISPNGCHQVVSLELNLVGIPRISIPDVVHVCEDSVVTVDAGVGFTSYLWSTGSTQRQITIGQPGNYSVTVTTLQDGVTCSATKNFTVSLITPTTITSVETNDWTASENTIVVNVTGAGEYLYSIDGINFQSDNVFTNLPSGPYTVVVTDANDCGTDTEEVYLLMYPRFFTPNGDGFNETWGIKFSHYEPGLSVSIFDRYGKLLKEFDHTGFWDGTYNGELLFASDYWFVVTRKDGTEHRGHFTLKR